MQVSVKTTSGLEREVKVAVPAESFEARVDERIKATANDARLPGFRPGKVPMKEVRRRFGAELRQQVATDMLQSSFADVVRQERLALASQAFISLDNIEPGGDLEYTATFEVMPTVQLADLTTLRVGKPKAEITEADIDETVQTMRQQRIGWHAVERAAQEGDRVTVDYTVKVAGKVVGEPTRETFVVGDEDNLDEVNGALVGLAAHESRVFPTTVPKDELDDAGDEGEEAPGEDDGDGAQAAAPEADSDGSGDAGGGGEQDAEPEVPETAADAVAEALAEPPLAGELEPLQKDDNPVPAIAEIVAHSVEEGVLPDLDDEFFDSFDVDHEGDRLAKFREQVRERMQVELDNATRHLMRRQVLDALVGAHDFELPQAMVTAELADHVGRMKRLVGDIDEALFAQAFRPKAEENVRARLTLQQVILHANIKPDDQRVRTRIEEIASAYEEAAEVRRWLYGNEEQLRRVENSVAEQQAVEHVLAQANAIPVELSYEQVVAGVLPALPAEEADAPVQADAPAQADTPVQAEEAALPTQPAGEASSPTRESDDGAQGGEPASVETADAGKTTGIRGRLRRLFGARKD